MLNLIFVGSFNVRKYSCIFENLNIRNMRIPVRIELIPRTLGPSNDFTLLNGWICLHGVLD